jgi:phage gpG-like protein
MTFPSLIGKIEGATLFNRQLDAVGHVFEDNQPTLEEVAERGFYPIMQEIFDTEGRGRWRREEMSPAYRRRKRAIHGDKPILQATGSLMRSMTRKRATGNIHIGVGPNTLLLGSDLPQAHPLDKRFGIIDLTPADIELLTEVAEESMRDRIEDEGLKTK